MNLVEIDLLQSIWLYVTKGRKIAMLCFNKLPVNVNRMLDFCCFDPIVLLSIWCDYVTNVCRKTQVSNKILMVAIMSCI